MKKFISLLAVMILAQVALAQNPFKQFGDKSRILTMTNGKFHEFHDLDSVVQIGSVLLDVNKKIIVGYVVPSDTVEYLPNPTIISRWWSVDPLADKYFEYSPYNFTLNNPIRYVDPDGRYVDDFYFNQDGEMINRVVNDQPDRFFVQTGQQVTGTIEEGTIKLETTFAQIDMNSDLGQMARTVYAEAGGENTESKLAVAEVIRNRANDETPNSAANGWAAIFSNDTPTEVVQQKGQFESVQSGAKRYADPQAAVTDADGTRNERETNALVGSVGAAIKATNQNTNTTQGATYFYSPYIKAPSWTGKLQEVSVPGVSTKSFKFYKFK